MSKGKIFIVSGSSFGYMISGITCKSSLFRFYWCINSTIGIITIVHFFAIQVNIKMFQKWLRSIYNTIVIIFCNIIAIS